MAQNLMFDFHQPANGRAYGQLPRRRILNPANEVEFAHIAKVCQGLHKHLQDKAYCDVKVMVGDTSFDAHKLVLASSSSVFERMFASGFAESRESEVHVTGTPEAFKILLDFIYIGKLDFIGSDVGVSTTMDVLRMAHYLEFSLVVTRCKQKLLHDFKELGLPDVIQIMAESDIYELHDLDAGCREYLAKKFQKSDDFLEYMTCELILLTMEHRDFSITEEKEVFDIIVAWLKHDWDARKEFAPQLFNKIRLGAVPQNHMATTFLNTPELNSIPECQAMMVKVAKLVDAKTAADPPLSVSHPNLFETRSTVTTIINALQGRFFDASKKCWEKLSQFPPVPAGTRPHNSYSCVVSNQQLGLYVAGGTPEPQFLTLDMESKQWKELTPMAERPGKCCLVPCGSNHIYAFGGVGVTDEESRKCEVYVINEDAWHDIAPLRYPLSKVWPNSAVVYEGKILLFGEETRGISDTNRINLTCNLMLYDPDCGTWNVLANFTYSETSPGLTSGLIIQDGKCYRVVGGGKAQFVVHELVLDVDKRTCVSNEVLQEQEQDSIPTWLNMHAFNIGQTLYMICGGGYHKLNVDVACIEDKKDWLRVLGTAWSWNEDCVTSFAYDKAMFCESVDRSVNFDAFML